MNPETEAVAPPVSTPENPVIVNPDTFVRERRVELLRLRTKVNPLQFRVKRTDRRVLCNACFVGLHPCKDKECPCVCRQRISA